jgi:hypothetical protein
MYFVAAVLAVLAGLFYAAGHHEIGSLGVQMCRYGSTFCDNPIYVLVGAGLAAIWATFVSIRSGRPSREVATTGQEDLARCRACRFSRLWPQPRGLELRLGGGWSNFRSNGPRGITRRPVVGDFCSLHPGPGPRTMIDDQHCQHAEDRNRDRDHDGMVQHRFQ